MPIDPQIILAQRPVDMPDVAKIQGDALAIQEGQARARDRVQAARDKQIQSQQADQLQQVLASSQTTDPVTGITTWDRAKIAPFLAHMPPAVSKQVLDLMDQSDEQVTKAQAHQMDVLKTSARMVQATGSDATVFLAELDRLIKNHQVSENTAAPIMEAVKRDPAHAAAIVDAILGGKPGEGQVTLNQGDIRIDPTGKVIASNPKAPTAPEVGSFGDYVIRTYGDNPTSAQIEKARKDYSAAGREPSTSATGAAAGIQLNPTAIDMMATRYRLFPTNTIPSRFDRDDKIKIINAADKQRQALGQTAAAVVQGELAAKADSSALGTLQKMQSTAQAFETKALAQADKIDELSAKASRSDMPFINSIVQSGQIATGNTPQHLLANAIMGFQNEYAKILEGSTGSVAAVGKESVERAKKMISEALSKGTLKQTVDLMRWEMHQTVIGYEAAKQQVQENIAGIAGGQSGSVQGLAAGEKVSADGKYVYKDGAVTGHIIDGKIVR